MRLDRFLCEMNLGSRSQVKSYVRQGLVTVNGALAKSPDRQVDELSDQIAFRGEPLRYQKFVYYMMNKPIGVVSATSDRAERTVVSLLGKDAKEGIFPVGRLDKDTTGLLLLTDDGGLAHRLLAPRKHVDKTYRVSIAHKLAEGDVRRLEEGLDIGEEKPTLPARVTLLEDTEILLTIQEGKFHQVKRMLQAVDNQVLALKRVSFGELDLDETLRPGEYRELTEEELERLSGDAEGETAAQPRKAEEAEAETADLPQKAGKAEGVKGELLQRAREAKGETSGQPQKAGEAEGETAERLRKANRLQNTQSTTSAEQEGTEDEA